ncbi:MAG: hypothetical protein AAGC93_05705 [Cyanobacteria bacterium P01_F01_bin.53]
MVTPLEQFRAQYPSAALVSDLVSTQDGQYVVRTAIVQKGETLATGLSASVDVQIAEDRARDRAIALLGITSGRTTPTVSNNSTTAEDTATPAPSVPAAAAAPALKVASKAQSVPVSPAAPAKLSPAKPSPPNPVTKKQSPAVTPAAPTTPSAKPSVKTSVQTDIATLEPDTELQFEPEEVPPMSPEEDLGPPIDAIEESPTEITAPSKPSAAAIALESLSTSTSPVDLSDVIAQTDVELTRLGWTSAQGREYLEATYGKRSRQQLTDEELMSFLLYLEDQS